MKYDKKQLLAAVDSVFDDAVSLRRQLHMHPELSEQETETARLIALQLDVYKRQVSVRCRPYSRRS